MNWIYHQGTSPVKFESCGFQWGAIISIAGPPNNSKDKFQALLVWRRQFCYFVADLLLFSVSVSDPSHMAQTGVSGPCINRSPISEMPISTRISRDVSTLCHMIIVAFVCCVSCVGFASCFKLHWYSDDGVRDCFDTVAVFTAESQKLCWCGGIANHKVFARIYKITH